MRQADPAMSKLARQMLAREAAGGRDVAATTDALERAGDKLRRYLTPPLGTAGFQTLLAHARASAAAEFPWLAGVKTEPDGAPWNGLRGACAGRETQEVSAGLTCLLAHVFGLLAAFIGEERTEQLARQVWPDADRDAANFR